MPILGIKGDQGGGQGVYMKEVPAVQAKTGIGSVVCTPLYSTIMKKKYGDLGTFLEATGSQILTEINVPVGRGVVPIKVIYSEQENTHLPVIFLYDESGNLFKDLYADPNPDSLGGYVEAIVLPMASLMIQDRLGIQFDVYHFNDWQTAYGTLFLKEKYQDKKWPLGYRPASLFTTHNLEYQGLFPGDLKMTARDSGVFDYLEKQGVLGEHARWGERPTTSTRVTEKSTSSCSN